MRKLFSFSLHYLFSNADCWQLYNIQCLLKFCYNLFQYRAWARPEAINQAPYSLDVGVDILTYFENFFNIPFPLQKQGKLSRTDVTSTEPLGWLNQ